MNEPATNRVGKGQDFHAWLLDQAARLRPGDMHLDRESLAEELEDMAARERRELRSHLEQLLKHLLKWQFQPTLAEPSEAERAKESATCAFNRRGTSWRNSVKLARRGVEDLLEDSPSIGPLVSELMLKAYVRARTDAADEMKLKRTEAAQLPETCPWTFDQFVDADFWPGRKKVREIRT